MERVLDFLKSVLMWIWRKKSIIGILSLLVGFLIAELVAIENSEGLEALFSALKADKEYQHWYYVIWFIEVLVVKGSWYTVAVLGVTILWFGWLKYHEIRASQVKVAPRTKVKAHKIDKVTTIETVEGDVHI